jgi:2-dehydro-3-deoxyglucarate aldolase
MLNINDFRKKLAAGKVSIGSWLSAPSPMSAAAVASCGFDWVAIDLEHSSIDIDQAQNLFISIERHGVLPMVRLPSADPFLARRMLDCGAQGLIIPVVEEVTPFQSFLEYCLYPPAGRRGVGLSRCNLWGDVFRSYLQEFRPIIVPQIETMKGVASADALASLSAVDALFLGPYDLSANLGDGGNFTTDAFKQAESQVLEACIRHGKAPAIHQVAPITAELQEKVAQGFRLIAFSTDMLAMRASLKTAFSVD